MKKLILTFLLVLLPMQFAQAALCSYYCDELPVGTQQTSDQQLPNLPVPDQPDSIISADSHQDNQANAGAHRCAFCSMSHAKFVNHQPLILTPSSAVASFHPEAITYKSHISHGLDRPNWTQFA